jgi:hypothetical protein
MGKATLQKLKHHSYFFSFDTAIVEKLAMGDIMQVKCTTVEEATEVDGVAWLTSQLGLTYLSIYTSCCYFALATEIRLAIPEAEREQPEHAAELQIAKLHHLHSIVMASEFVLVESNYLNHIIRSFKNNFKQDVLEDGHQSEQPGNTSRLNEDNQEWAAEGGLLEHRSDEGTQVDICLPKSSGKVEEGRAPPQKKISARRHSGQEKLKSPRNKLGKGEAQGSKN